jgi:exosortase N
MQSPDLTTLLSLGLLVFAGWPGSFGRTRWTGRLATLALLSPGLRYVFALFSFPIRLQLSAWAGNLLCLAGINVQVEGNVLVRNGVEMSVDPACMGLQLTGISLLVALFFLIWQERQTHKAVPFYWVMGYSTVAFGLTILCNLFRIVLLVAFGAMPNTWAHEIIGLVCVAAYAWLPAWYLAKAVVNWTGRSEKGSVENWASMVKASVWGLCLLAIILGAMAFDSKPNKPLAALNQLAKIPPAIQLEYGTDFRCKMLTNGFVQLAKPGLLIYLKPQTSWLSADHSPLVCWRGSGYELRYVRETVLNGHPAYVGELHKKGRVLHTAWWFSNGAINTVSQLTMRSHILRGETGFVLVNVTTDKK